MRSSNRTTKTRNNHKQQQQQWDESAVSNATERSWAWRAAARHCHSFPPFSQPRPLSDRLKHVSCLFFGASNNQRVEEEEERETISSARRRHWRQPVWGIEQATRSWREICRIGLSDLYSINATVLALARSLCLFVSPEREATFSKPIAVVTQIEPVPNLHRFLRLFNALQLRH